MTGIPIKFGLNQIFEESSISETFIKYSSSEGKVIHASIEKKGSNLSYAYTLKTTIQKGDQKVMKKKVISASEYIELMQNKIPEMSTLSCNRVCTIDQGIYMIIDYYPKVDGQPVICIIQVNAEELKKTGKRVSLPKYLNIKKDITDMDQFQPFALAHKSYQMPNLDENDNDEPMSPAIHLNKSSGQPAAAADSSK